MGKVDNFEDLNCWKEARLLVRLAYETSGKGEFKKDRDLVSQFRRAAVSVMNNVAEGFGRFSNKEFIRFLDFAQSSAVEVKSMTYILIDLKYVSDEEFKKLQEQTDHTKNLILGLIKYLKNKNNKT